MPPMSSTRYATPLVLEPRPSRWLISLSVFFHMGTLPLIVLFAEWPWPLRVMLMSVVLLSLWLMLGKLAWRRSPGYIQRAMWQTGKDWRLMRCDGRTLTAELQPSSFLHPWLVVLNLRVEGRRLPISLVLARDSLDAASFRQLRVRLTVEAGSLFDPA